MEGKGSGGGGGGGGGAQKTSISFSFVWTAAKKNLTKPLIARFLRADRSRFVKTSHY